METITLLPDQSEILHYDNPAFPLYLKHSTLSLYPGKRVLCHWHQEMEFFLVEKGHPSYFVNGNIVSLQEGDGIFINSKCLHYGFSPDGSDSQYLCLVFMPTLLSPSPFLKSNYVDPLENHVDVPYLVLPSPLGRKLKEEMEAMSALPQEKKANYPLLVLSHLYSFWAEFLALRGQELPQTFPTNGKTTLLKTMLAYLYSHYPENLTLESLANSAAISPGYASHLFHDYLHDSPMNYLNAYRLEKASDLLIHSEKNISEIAAMVGFENPSYFTELFHRNKGLSPRAFQKLNQKGFH